MNTKHAEGGRSLAVRYAHDHGLQEAANAGGSNYWYAYVEEILSQLGVTATPMALEACVDAGDLAEVGVLFLGNFGREELPASAGGTLVEWVEAGGVLIGFAPEGLDNVFGIAPADRIEQRDGPFSIGGYFELTLSAVTQSCRAPIDHWQKLIITSPIRPARCSNAEKLARLFACHPEEPGDGLRAIGTDLSAITHRRLGAGHAFYFAFDVAQTVWTIQQGKPVFQDHDGDGYLRRQDASVIDRNSRAVPYSDAIHFLLASMMGRAPVPSIHAIPPVDGRVSPALFYFGGDDECSPGLQVPASDFMAEMGMPYHINLMPRDGAFAIGAEEQARIERNGHELALHYNFMDGLEHPCGFTREDVLAQARLFREAFGRNSICGVTHWCRWYGWADAGRWMAEAGNLADNSFIGWTAPPNNPVNVIGFVHGSALPRFLWDDAEHGNARVDCLEVPITGYEVGYLDEQYMPEKVHEAFSLAVRYRMPLCFFYHPIYVAEYPACREAIRELARLVGDMPVPPVLMGTDRMALWWRARTSGAIQRAARSGNRVTFEARCDWDEGFVVKVPTGAGPASACTVEGREAHVECAYEFGQYWAFIVLGPGSHSVELEL